MLPFHARQWLRTSHHDTGGLQSDKLSIAYAMANSERTKLCTQSNAYRSRIPLESAMALSANANLLHRVQRFFQPSQKEAMKSKHDAPSRSIKFLTAHSLRRKADSHQNSRTLNDTHALPLHGGNEAACIFCFSYFLFYLVFPWYMHGKWSVFGVRSCMGMGIGIGNRVGGQAGNQEPEFLLVSSRMSTMKYSSFILKAFTFLSSLLLSHESTCTTDLPLRFISMR